MNANSNAVVPSDEQKLSTQLAQRGVEIHTWNTLKNSIFPGAATASILMAIDYCLARKLDVLKKPCHIVPMQVKQGKEYIWRDVILPGIYEYRITAQRTGLYLGHTKPEYGPMVGPEGYEAPQYCDMTFFRWSKVANQSVPYPVRVYYREVVGLTKEGDVNARWSKAPIQMLTKCTEAAGLREAFPDEIGGEPTMEEMIDQIVSEQGRREPNPAASRVDAAKEALRAKLTDKSGDVNPLAGAYGEAVSQQALNTVQRNSNNDVQQKQTAQEQQRVKFKYDVATAVQALRGRTTSADLKKVFQEIVDDYDFTGRGEVPLDVEAIYRDLLEAIEEREAMQEEGQ